jgi:hypothetical protein
LPGPEERVFHASIVTTRPFFAVLASASVVALCACNGVSAVRPLSPRAQLVRVEDRDPPDDATALGAIAVTDGQGCSLTGDRGTREGATALLKESAAQRGADFVKITKVIEPYSGHDCYHREFKIEGLSYRLAGAPIVVPSAAPSAAAPAAPTALAAPPAGCDPICSPGYACESGVCRPQCNPACGEGQRCRVDRVCVPAAAAP